MLPVEHPMLPLDFTHFCYLLCACLLACLLQFLSSNFTDNFALPDEVGPCATQASILANPKPGGGVIFTTSSVFGNVTVSVWRTFGNLHPMHECSAQELQQAARLKRMGTALSCFSILGTGSFALSCVQVTSCSFRGNRGQTLGAGRDTAFGGVLNVDELLGRLEASLHVARNQSTQCRMTIGMWGSPAG